MDSRQKRLPSRPGRRCDAVFEAVRRRWRKLGLGLALLQHSFRQLHERGKKGVSLDVDASNLTGATRLYEKAGMSVTRQSDMYVQQLRPGRELWTRSAAP